MHDNEEHYKRVPDVHTHNTRAAEANSIYQPHCRLKRTQNYANYWGPKLYERVSPKLKNLPRESYTSKLKAILKDKAYYSLDEALTDKLGED